jgi:hypothetical protein
VEAPDHFGNQVLRYLAVIKAARDFGLPDEQIAATAGRFDPRKTRCAELADALADLIIARADFSRTA